MLPDRKYRETISDTINTQRGGEVLSKLYGRATERLVLAVTKLHEFMHAILAAESAGITSMAGEEVEIEKGRREKKYPQFPKFLEQLGGKEKLTVDRNRATKGYEANIQFWIVYGSNREKTLQIEYQTKRRGRDPDWKNTFADMIKEYLEVGKKPFGSEQFK